MKFLDDVIYGNTVRAWLTAVGAGLLLSLFLALLKLIASRRLRRRAESREERLPLIQEAVSTLLPATRWFFFLGLWLWVVPLLLELPEKWELFLKNVGLVALFVQLAVWAQALIRAGTGRARARRSDNDPGVVTTINALGFLMSVVVWTVVVLMTLHNFGVNITAFVTGLGIGGVAIALAVQNILSDLLSSASIVLDKPFEVGDFIIVGDAMGTVESIGLKTTRVRSDGGEMLIFSNSDLLKSRIRNFKRIKERRVEFTVGISYHTPHSKAEIVPGLLRDVISARRGARFDRAHLKEFGDASLTYEAVYFVLESDYSTYRDVQEAVLLDLFRRFQEEEIELASPTRTLYVAQGVAPVKW